MRSRLRPGLLVGMLLPALVCIGAAHDPGADALTVPRGQSEAAADAAKTIIDLQRFRRESSVPVQGAGGRRGTATLIELNPAVNAWYLLRLDWGDAPVTFHLENPEPRSQHIELAGAGGLILRRLSGGTDVFCRLWSGTPSALDQAIRAGLPYAPLCEGRLYLRNPVAGRFTGLELVTDFLRTYVWGGEKIIGFVRQQFFRDAYLEKGEAGDARAAVPPENADAPRPATLNTAFRREAVVPTGLAIDLGARPGGLVLGQWYPVNGLAGAFASVIQPKAIAGEIMSGHRHLVSALDAVEMDALAILVAFDLTAYEVGFALGTAHPSIGWSSHALPEVRTSNPRGPDGIETIAPLVANGMVSPAAVARTVATFTGGFKRDHGAFRYGELARMNRGSHYGFIEQGTVFARLVPGLATMYVLDSGAVRMKTWSGDDDAFVSKVKHARQNGVPLIAHDESTGISTPGTLIARWGPGNWSGSVEGKLRSLRAGACLVETSSTRFLVYGYFSSATPSAMARVFQAYGCRTAMHLDMNALEHTYLALYVRHGTEVSVQHLNEGMSQLDKRAGGRMVPRFLGFPDNRDFFYIVRREQPR
ncbi:MAG: hypothetical protein ACKVQU_37065 [Burkholderiales bacterium]